MHADARIPGLGESTNHVNPHGLHLFAPRRQIVAVPPLHLSRTLTGCCHVSHRVVQRHSYRQMLLVLEAAVKPA
jgi:hypothetical protein